MRNVIPASLCGFLLFLSSALGDEEKIPLDQVPVAVTDAVKAKYPGAKLTGAEKEAEDNGTVYEVAFKDQGQKYEAQVKPDGTLIAVDRDIQTSDLPATVAATLRKRFPKATLKNAEEVTKYAGAEYRHAGKVTKKDGEIVYEVVVSLTDGRRGEVVISPEGKFLEAKGLDRPANSDR
jgi:uncharacterized membrane protein YkoI